ncbi:hypothetical protein Tco_0286023 [Tanacetum coccineum]
MENLEFCDKHNMVAYLKKPSGSEGFQEIVDFLNGSHIRQALNKVTELPQTSEPIPNVPDEAVYEECDNRVERTTTTAVGLDAEQASGGSPRCQEAIGGSIAQTRSERVPTQAPPSKLESLEAIESKLTSIVLGLPLYQAYHEVSTASMVQEVNISIPSPVVVKDKGKGKMEEYEDEHTKRTKLQQEQDRLGHEAVVRLQEELDEEERQRMARVHEAAQSFTEEEWETLEQELKLIKSYLRDYKQRKGTNEAKRNKPMTQAQQKNYMINYIKHMGSHTLQQLKRYSFDELKELFETIMQNVNTFVPMEIEDRGRASELAARSSQATITDSAKVGSFKRVAEAELDHKGSKRQKTNEASGSVQEKPDEEEKELSQEDLQQMMMVVPVEEVYV